MTSPHMTSNAPGCVPRGVAVGSQADSTSNQRRKVRRKNNFPCSPHRSYARWSA